VLRIAIGFVIAGLAYGAKELPQFQEKYSFTVYIATISSAAVCSELLSHMISNLADVFPIRHRWIYGTLLHCVCSYEHEALATPTPEMSSNEPSCGRSVCGRDKRWRSIAYILTRAETGIITSSASILLVVFWSTMPGNALWLAVMIIYAKCAIIMLC
jgi:hypothetical protein